MADAVHGETAQILAQVTPRVEIPVLAIAHQPLRGDGALGGLAGRACVVADRELAAGEERLGGGLEEFWARRAAPEAQDFYAALDFFKGVVGAFEERAQTLFQRIDVAAQQPRLQFVEQMLHGEERRGFGGVEPEAGEATRPRWPSKR